MLTYIDLEAYFDHLLSIVECQYLDLANLIYRLNAHRRQKVVVEPLRIVLVMNLEVTNYVRNHLRLVSMLPIAYKMRTKKI